MAFQEFSQMVRKVQLLTKQRNPDRATIDAAFLELEKVRVGYNSRRDSLARHLLSSSASAKGALGEVARDQSQASAIRIKEMAELLWEFSGRPEGTADDDWHRAEEILRRAVAA